MALSKEDKQELLNAIKAESQSVTELKTVDNLNGVQTLPAMKGQDLVSVPIKVLSAPAEKAADEARKAADEARETSKQAEKTARTAEKAATKATAEGKEAKTAAEDARSAAAEAREAAEHIDEKIGDIKDKTGGTGSGFYNVSKEHPLSEGYYTLQTAIDALHAAAITQEDKRGMIISFEAAANTWEDYRYTHSDASHFFEPVFWAKYGSKGALKELQVNMGVEEKIVRPDEDGKAQLTIPTVDVDETITPTGTNPVQGKAVHAALNQIEAGAALQLNTIGEGMDKAYSLSLLDKNNKVLSTTETFTGGGGGGAVSSTKVVLTRLTENKTVKLGDNVKVAFKYDQIDTETGSTTGNPGRATIKIAHGASVQTIEQTLSPSSTVEIDVTPYIGLGSNTVRVRVEVGEEEFKQVGSVAWSISTVQLQLASSFNVASVVERGDEVNLPFALKGSGNKTLRLYVDGRDVEDRTIGTSSANGSFAVRTEQMAHGEHSLQLVAELEQADGSVIRSNSIYFDIAVREEGQTGALVATRFDYADGTVIRKGERPFVSAMQFDRYALVYAPYNPKEQPTEVRIYEVDKLLSAAFASFARTEYKGRAMQSGESECRIEVGDAAYRFSIRADKTDLHLTEPTDNLELKLSALGRSNDDTMREEWRWKGVRTAFEGFTWGGDGWTGDSLRFTENARAKIDFRPFASPGQNATGAMAFMIRFKVSNVIRDNVEIIRCVDKEGHGLVVTTQEAKMRSAGGSEVETKFATGEVYNIGFVAFPPATDQSTEYEKLNDNMLYIYVNGIMSGGVQRGKSDSIYQANPQAIEIGTNGCTTDIYSMRAYSYYLTDAQMLDAYMLDLGGADELLAKYKANDVLDDNGMISVESLPDDLPYIVITGRQENGMPTVLHAAVQNAKKPKYDVDEILYVDRLHPERNFVCKGGCIRLQGTSSLAYPTKNYRIYFKNSLKEAGELYLGCNEFGAGGNLQEEAKYSLRPKGKHNKEAVPVDCFCFKADYAESSSTHNTGMAKLAERVLKATGELTPSQKHVDTEQYPYEIRTTVDGFPCMMFYRATAEDTPQFLGKFNFNNDKSTEDVFGFHGIPGYHDQPWMTEKFEGANPTECWEFQNNDYPMGSFLDDDFDRKDEKDGIPVWLKVFESRFPDDDADNAAYERGEKKPKYLEALVKWVASTNRDLNTISSEEKERRAEKFRTELGDYFDVSYLCDYYVLTEVFGCVDQRVKNMMLSFWYVPEKDKVLAQFIFYDNDTILGVRNDGRLKYGWDIDHNTIDPELSTPEKTVYAYAGHDSVLWNNLRELFADKIEKAYKRLRAKMSNDFVFNIFDKEQGDKYCERIYNKDGLLKYVHPKTKGVQVIQDGNITTKKYSFMEAMQGSRKAHRHWWLTNRFTIFDAKHMTGRYMMTDLAFKGNSVAGATIKAWATREFYFAMQREGTVISRDKVKEGEEWSYSYDQMANIGTIFHFYGGEYAGKIDLSGWGGFTDLTLPRLPRLEELVMGAYGQQYNLTELAVGDKLPMLRKLDIRNYKKLPSLDLSQCEKLQTVDARGCSKLSTINFAEGSPIKDLYLPDNFQTLTLRSLPNLNRSGIHFGDIEELEGLWVENCREIDAFKLFGEITNKPNSKLHYVRIPDVNLEGDGSDLKEWYDAKMGGIDAEGNVTTRHCKIAGNYQLTAYLPEDEYALYVDYFDELNIRQPQYTMIEFDNSVADDANISNLDNKTGYKFGNIYMPSAHINAIRGKRHRVLAKVTKMPTTRKVNIADQDTTVNNLDGEMTYYPLHDEDSNFYADRSNTSHCTAAKLDGSEGDWMMYEPAYWYKGVNDYLNHKQYSLYSSNEDMPDRPDCTILMEDELKKKNKTKLLINHKTIKESYASDSNFSVCEVSVKGYQRVRFPSVPGTGLIGASFVASGGKVIKDIIVPTIGCTFEAGMYLVADIPAEANKLYFTISNKAAFDKVVLTKSDRIEDIEPDWVHSDEYLCGVVGSTVQGTKLRACIGGGTTTTGNMTWIDFHYYSNQRGMQQIDYLMHSHIANLFYATYGRRNSQAQCGAGQWSENRKTGGTSILGMMDTVNKDPISGREGNYWTNEWDSSKPTLAFYRTVDEDGEVVYKTINNTNCIGYEDIYGNKYDMMDGVDVPQNIGGSGNWRIWMPDGSIRWVQGKRASGQFIVGVAHGKYMDMVPVGNASGTATTHYCDKFWLSGGSRVVFRGPPTRMRMAVSRVRMRTTMPRIRVRTSARVSPSAENS